MSSLLYIEAGFASQKTRNIREYPLGDTILKVEFHVDSSWWNMEDFDVG